MIGTTTTANDGTNDGAYLFDNLDPDLTYVVEFVAPDGSDFTTQDQGDDATDSDADGTSGFTGPIDLAPGEYNDTIDAGLVDEPPVTASLGDFVWEDTKWQRSAGCG